MAQHILPAKTAVLYLRMSSSKQDKSIDAQRNELIALAKRQSYQVVREYQDLAISGDESERRPGFMRLRDDAEKLRDFSTILVWDTDRFSRNDPLELGYWLKPIRDAGVVLETPQGKVDWETLGGRLIYMISQEMKHDYLRSLSRNVSRGMLAASRRETHVGTGGRDPDGYQHDSTGVVTINQDRAAIIRRIFAEYAKPKASLRSVVEALNVDGIKTSRGKKWCVTTIRDTLTNKKYTGSFVRFKYRCGKYHAIEAGEIVGRSKTDRWEVVAPVVVEGNHEAIVPQELFDQVQRKLGRQKKHTAHRTGRQYLFASLIRCGDCGGPMGGFAHAYGKGAKKQYLVYGCRTFHNQGRSACNSNTIGEDRLLDCVVRMITEQYASDAGIDRLREQHRQQRVAEQTPVSPVDQRQLRKQIEGLDTKIDTGAERVFTAPAGIVPKLYAKLDELRQERDQLQRQLDAVGDAKTVSNKERDQEVEAALDALRTLRETFSKADPEDVRELITTLVARIDLHYSHRRDGKKTRNTVKGGTIWLRPPAGSSLLVGTPEN